MHKLPIPIIVGPTASGKTEAGISLAHALHGEVVSADSRQIYRFLSIGTTKPKGRWKGRGNERRFVVQGVVHHLVDCFDPREVFSAGEFVRAAAARLNEIHARGRTAILVGGTGLYLRALIRGLAPLPPRDLRVREALLREAETKGRETLHAKLKRIDPVAARNIPPRNIQRLVRALEVYQITGQPISLLQKQTKPVGPWNFRLFGLRWPREALHRRIEERSHQILPGLLRETKLILNKGYPATCPGLLSLGYREACRYIRGEISRPDLLKELTSQTRAYAKRQMTWFRKEPGILWTSMPQRNLPQITRGWARKIGD